MPDIEAPADLVALKREFLAADADLTALVATLPSSASIAGGEAAFTEDEQRAWDRLQAARAELAVQIHRHAAFEGLSGLERLALDEAASRAAKASVAA